MEPDENIGASFSMLVGIKDQLMLLGLSGVAGAFFRALLAPQEDWKRRVTQGIGGALSAIFLGGFAASVTDQLIGGHPPYSWLAWGFIMGTGGEVAVKFVQDKLMGNSDESNTDK